MARNRKNRTGDGDGGAHWISYSDLATGLLLVFVLLLVSLLLIQKQSEAARARKVEALLQRLEGVLQRQDQIGERFQSYLTENQCRVEWRDGRIEFIDLENAFLSGETRINSNLIPKLEICGAAIQGFLLDHPEFRDQVEAILIEGHTDAEKPPSNEDAYDGNLQLSLGRTQEVAKYLSKVDDRAMFAKSHHGQFDEIHHARDLRPISHMDPNDIRMFMVASGRSYADFDRDRWSRADLFEQLGEEARCEDLDKGLEDELCSEWAVGKCGCYRRFDLMLRVDYEKLFKEIRGEIEAIREAL